MAKTKIKSDSHGLYVRTDGRVFRPFISKYSYSAPRTADTGTARGFKAGDEIMAKHVEQTMFARIKDGCIEELWHSHGCYIKSLPRNKTANIGSEDLWDPA